MTKQISGTTGAWITDYQSIGVINRADAAASLAYSDNDNMTSVGWTKVGTATITVELLDQNELIDGKVTALRAQAKEVAFQAAQHTKRIEDEISNLLAIGCDAPRDDESQTPVEYRDTSPSRATADEDDLPF